MYKYEFWATDGTSSGTQLIKDIRPGRGTSIFATRAYQVINGRFYFTADNGVNGRQIWASDLTAGGTRMIDTLTGGNLRFVRSRGPNTILFTTINENTGLNLWAYDLDVDGDRRIDVNDNCQDIANADQLNFDRDEFGDACDSDADNDGMPAKWEQRFGLDDLNPSDASLDSDGDGFTNIREFLEGTNPQIADPDCNNDGVADRLNKCTIMAPIFSLLLGAEVGLPIDPLPTPNLFRSGNSGSEGTVEFQTFLPEQVDFRFTTRIVDSAGNETEIVVDFGVP